MSSVYARGWFLALAALFVPAVATPDAVTEWNQRAGACALEAEQYPFAVTRTVAIVHTAMFDAMNSIEGRYALYKFKPLSHR